MMIILQEVSRKKRQARIKGKFRKKKSKKNLKEWF